MTKIHIVASFPTTEDHRDHARITVGIAPEIEALEEKIEALTGEKVRVSVVPRRSKVAAETSSELGHG